MQSASVSRSNIKFSGKHTELSNVHDIVLILQDSSFVVIYVKIVWCAENGHNTRESSSPGLPVHSITGILSLVRTNNRKQIVFFEESACRGV